MTVGTEQTTGSGDAPHGNIRLHYEIHGDVGTGRPLLLISGMSQQLIDWPADLLAELVGRGHAVVVFDNRDVGCSTHLDGVRADMKAIRAGAPAPYVVADMAEDALAVLDAVGWRSAHVAGVSLGGMIAQAVAIAAPHRVRSLTSLLSTTGDRTLGRPRPGTMGVLMAAPPQGRAEYVEHQLRLARLVGSVPYPTDEQELRARAARAYERSFDPRGLGRQVGAILASPDRTEQLRRLDIPALVVHGADDPLVDVSGGQATAAALRGARLLVVDGMGHDLPRQRWPLILDALASLTRVADRRHD